MNEVFKFVSQERQGWAVENEKKKFELEERVKELDAFSLRLDKREERIRGEELSKGIN